MGRQVNYVILALGLAAGALTGLFAPTASIFMLVLATLPTLVFLGADKGKAGTLELFAFSYLFAAAAAVLFVSSTSGIPGSPLPQKALVVLNGEVLQVAVYPKVNSTAKLAQLAESCLKHGKVSGADYVSVSKVFIDAGGIIKTKELKECGHLPVLRYIFTANEKAVFVLALLLYGIALAEALKKSGTA